MKKQKGISLTELMVTAVILGTVMLIAIPSYERLIGSMRAQQIKTDLVDLQKKWLVYTAGSGSFCRNMDGECPSIYRVGAGHLISSRRYDRDIKGGIGTTSDPHDYRLSKDDPFYGLCTPAKHVPNPFRPAAIGFTQHECGGCDMTPGRWRMCKHGSTTRTDTLAGVGGSWVGRGPKTTCANKPRDFKMGAVSRTYDSLLGDKVILAHYTITDEGKLAEVTNIKHTLKANGKTNSIDDNTKNDYTDASGSVGDTCVKP